MPLNRIDPHTFRTRRNREAYLRALSPLQIAAAHKPSWVAYSGPPAAPREPLRKPDETNRARILAWFVGCAEGRWPAMCINDIAADLRINRRTLSGIIGQLRRDDVITCAVGRGGWKPATWEVVISATGLRARFEPE